MLGRCGVTMLVLAIAAGCGGGGGGSSSAVPQPPAVATTPPAFPVPAKPSFAVPPKPSFATPANPAPGAAPPASPQKRAAFFAGEVALGGGIYSLVLPNGSPFGTYTYLPDSNYIRHSDLGYEYVVDANDASGGVYLYDFQSSHWWYTARTLAFPYLYDFTLNSLLYYYQDPTHTSMYTRSPRYFYNFGPSTVITLPDPPLTTPTPVPTALPIATPTVDPSALPTPTGLPTVPPVVTPTPIGTPTLPPVVTPTPVGTPTLPPVVTPTPVATLPPVVTPTPVATLPPVVTPSPIPTPTAIPTLPPIATPTPWPSPVASPSSLSFTTTVMGSDKWFRVTEPTYNGAFHEDGTFCTGIAIVQQGIPGWFGVYPIGAGACNIVIMDERNGRVLVPISVTTTTVGGQ